MTLKEKLKIAISNTNDTRTIDMLEKALIEIERIEEIEKITNKITELEQITNAEPEVIQAIPSEIRYLQRKLHELEK